LVSRKSEQLLIVLLPGIGAATARAFAEAGCKRIAITDRNADLLERTKDSIASKWPDVEVWSEAGDISVEEFVDNFMKNVVDKFGSIDYAVNCAGVLGQALRSHEMDTAEFDRINGINYRGCWLSSRAELKQMVKQDLPVSDDSGRPPQRGAIVNIASQLGIVGRAAAGKSPICTTSDFASGVRFFLKIPRGTLH